MLIDCTVCLYNVYRVLITLACGYMNGFSDLNSVYFFSYCYISRLIYSLFFMLQMGIQYAYNRFHEDTDYDVTTFLGNNYKYMVMQLMT
jgi:hypothetical protein